MRPRLLVTTIGTPVGAAWDARTVQAPELLHSARTECALLWDLDNVTPRKRHLASLAAALSELTGADGLKFAAARRGTFRAVREQLAGHGIQALSGGTRRNGADRVLLAQARTLSRVGVQSFVVASNDHRFSRIAALGNLHVVTLDQSGLSSRLMVGACSVTKLVLSDNGWHLESLSRF